MRPERPETSRHRPHPGRGLYFDDFALGQVFETAGRTITESDVVSFAGLSGDYNPVHLDREHAARTVFRERIAHGLLIESIASGLAHGTGIFDGTITALRDMEIRFVRPVLFGDTVRLRLEVVELQAAPGPKRAQVRFSTTVMNQRAEAVVEGAWGVVFLRRPALDAAADPAPEVQA